MYTVGFGSRVGPPVAAPAGVVALVEAPVDDCECEACSAAAAYGSSHSPAGVRSKAPSGDHARRRKKCVELASLYSLTDSTRDGVGAEPEAAEPEAAEETPNPSPIPIPPAGPDDEPEPDEVDATGGSDGACCAW